MIPARPEHRRIIMVRMAEQLNVVLLVIAARAAPPAVLLIPALTPDLPNAEVVIIVLILAAQEQKVLPVAALDMNLIAPAQQNAALVATAVENILILILLAQADINPVPVDRATQHQAQNQNLVLAVQLPALVINVRKILLVAVVVMDQEVARVLLNRAVPVPQVVSVVLFPVAEKV